VEDHELDRLGIAGSMLLCAAATDRAIDGALNTNSNAVTALKHMYLEM
jgi:hypothetical protein